LLQGIGMNAHDESDMSPDERERFEEETLHGDVARDDRLPASDEEVAKEHVAEEPPFKVPPIPPD
jgi:hypothetical protein